MSIQNNAVPPKFNIGDEVIADGDHAFVTQIIPAADSEWTKSFNYAVEWRKTRERGTFTEDELLKVN